MKGLLTACIAVGALWVVDVQMDDGRYSAVVQNAIMSVFPKIRPLRLRRTTTPRDRSA
jgi:hypothetical protein